MAYASWSVVFGEQPSAAKWNILGTNDAHFNTRLGYSAYCFRAYDSGGTTIADNSATKINLATEEYDYGSNFSGSTYTAPIAGVYHFFGRFEIGTIATGVDASARVFKNGSEVFRGVQLAAAYTSDQGFTVNGDVLLAASDTVEFYGYQNSAGTEATVTGSARTYFGGHLVHPV